MLFQHTLSHVLNRQKTQTRRLIKPQEIAVRGACYRIEAVKHNGREKWRIGKCYAVQPARGYAAVGSIRLLSIHSEYVRRISTAAARAEASIVAVHSSRSGGRCMVTWHWRRVCGC